MSTLEQIQSAQDDVAHLQTALAAVQTGLDTVDVGAPQLAMHSARETTGASDPGYLRRALSAVFE